VSKAGKADRAGEASFAAWPRSSGWTVLAAGHAGKAVRRVRHRI